MRAREANSKTTERPTGRLGTAGLVIWLGLALAALPSAGCGDIDDEVDDSDIDEIFESEVTGQVTDNRGAPLAGVTVRLYDLTDNQDFVVGHDVSSAEAYIDKDAVLGSDNFVASADTGDDGSFRIEGT